MQDTFAIFRLDLAMEFGMSLGFECGVFHVGKERV